MWRFEDHPFRVPFKECGTRKGGVMIAQVFKTSGSPPQTEDNLKTSQAVMERLRAVDGCEGMYALVDRTTGDGLALALWRDEAAMKAATGAQAAELADSKTTNPTVKVGKAEIYEVIASA